MNGDIGLGGSEAGGLGDAGYGPSGPSDVGGGGMSQADAEAAINAALNAPSNVVSSPESGAWTDASGQGIVSQGMNISLGLDPTHGAIGPYAGTNPNAVNQATLNAIAAELGVPVGQLIGFAGFDEYGNKDYSQISNGLVDYGTLNAAQAAGLGHLGLTNNQTIDQALAAKNTSDFLDVAVPAAVSILGSQIPGYGAISTIGRVGAGLMSGSMTPGQAITAGLSGLIGSKTGLPAGMVEAALSGNMGRAAGSGAVSGLSALANALTGNPYAGGIAAATLGPSLGKSVSEAVGGSSSRGGGLPGMLDQGLGTSNWGGIFGGASAPSTSTTSTGNTYGDAYDGINPDTYAVTAAIEQAAQEATQPSWKRETVAGRYGPTVQYEFGA